MPKPAPVTNNAVTASTAEPATAAADPTEKPVTANASAKSVKPLDGTGNPNAATAANVPAPPSLPPFIVERQPGYRLGSVPVSGLFNLDFDSDAGRQYARDLAHDLLMQAEDREAVRVDEDNKKIDRLAALLVTTTDVDEATARTQAVEMIAAGIEFKKQ